MRGLRLRRPHKYGATKVKIDGYTFASKLEAGRFQELKLLEKAGAIRDLTVHPRYRIDINGEHICYVVLDFSYFHRDSGLHVEDTKGKDLPMSKLKRKLMKAVRGIDVKVISA